MASSHQLNLKFTPARTRFSVKLTLTGIGGPKGKALMREIVRLVRSDHQVAMKLRSADLRVMSKSRRDIGRDQWLSRLVAAGRKLDPEDVKLAMHLVETLISFRQMLR